MIHIYLDYKVKIYTTASPKTFWRIYFIIISFDFDFFSRTFSSFSMSVFIRWFSLFDVNLFRHRLYRCIIVSVNKTKISKYKYKYKMDSAYMQVVDLRKFLQERGVSCSFHWKYHLERPCKQPHVIEAISKNVDFVT